MSCSRIFIGLRMAAWCFFLVSCLFSQVQAEIGVIEAARYSGHFGLRVALTGDQQTFLTNRDISEPAAFRARFYMRLVGLSLEEGESAQVFSGQDVSGGHLFRVTVSRTGGNLRLGFAARLNDMTYVTIPAGMGPEIGAGWHGLELIWTAADQNGVLQFILDGNEHTGLVKLDNGSGMLDSVSIGLIDGQDGNYSGFVDFDDYEARERGEIGIICFAKAEFIGQFANWPATTSTLNLIAYLAAFCDGS